VCFAPSSRQLQPVEEATRSIGQRFSVAKASTDEKLDASPSASAPYVSFRQLRT
jgi:hypothetical protein